MPGKNVFSKIVMFSKPLGQEYHTILQIVSMGVTFRRQLKTTNQEKAKRNKNGPTKTELRVM